MTLPKDAVVQLTHDVQLRRGLLIKKGTGGRVLSRAGLHHTYAVKFNAEGNAMIIATVSEADLVEVRPTVSA